MHNIGKAEQFINDQKVACLVALLWGYSALMPYILQTIKMGTSSELLAAAFNYIIVGTVILFAVKPIFSRLSKSDILFFLAFGLVFDLSILFYPINADYIINILPRFFFTVLPYYFVGRAIVDFKLTMKYLHKVSIIVLIANVAYYLYYLSSGRIFHNDNMDFAYNVLPSILILLYTALEKGGIQRWIIGIGGALFTMIQGTRGPVVCVLAFLLMYFLLNITNIKKLLLYILFLAVGGFIAFNNSFLVWIQQFGVLLEKYNISSRVIQMFLQNDFTNDNGRAYLYEHVIDGIKQHPFLGNGIMGDRVLTQGFQYAVGGSYVHNLLFELWCDYGVIIGSVLLLVLLVLIWKALKNGSDRETKYFIVILIALGIVKLMLSGSYLYEPYLFLLLGVCVRSSITRKVKRNP